MSTTGDTKCKRLRRHAWQRKTGIQITDPRYTCTVCGIRVNLLQRKRIDEELRRGK